MAERPPLAQTRITLLCVCICVLMLICVPLLQPSSLSPPSPLSGGEYQSACQSCFYARVPSHTAAVMFVTQPPHPHLLAATGPVSVCMCGYMKSPLAMCPFISILWSCCSFIILIWMNGYIWRRRGPWWRSKIPPASFINVTLTANRRELWGNSLRRPAEAVTAGRV